MQWHLLAHALFPLGHAITERDGFLCGSAHVGGDTIAVVGTSGHAPIGVEIALAQAQAILDVVRSHPRRAILLLIDTEGQRLRHRDEMLGIQRYMAHLAKCIDLARRKGHGVFALVYGQALSGGFVASGLMADACYALPDAAIHVMGLAPMARIMRIPEQRLRELAASNPVFAPGPENLLRMGGLEALWDGDLAAQLEQALAAPHAGDTRSALGLARGGRKLAQPVIDAILSGDCVHPAASAATQADQADNGSTAG